MVGETYDARRELGAWSSAGYDDSSWHAVVLAPDLEIVVEHSPGPPVRRQEILAGKARPGLGGHPHLDMQMFDFA